MKKHKNTISRITEGSIAEEMGIEVGDILLSINGRDVLDIMDYLFFMSDDYLELAIEKKDGEIWDLEIDKDYNEDIGIEFNNPILDQAKSCSNKCVFCFIDQMPPNMRKTLYFKDDDSRLAFLQGNFVTLTNMKKTDLERMVEYRISPVNVSIHTTNPDLRVSMLGNRFAGDVLERLTYLTDNGIEVNGQIVLCKGYNDGAELDRTLTDLGAMAHKVRSVAVVPFGMTKYREGLAQVEAFNQADCQALIEQVAGWQKRFKKASGSRFVFASDEFYITAGMEMPAYKDYEGFIQLENGVGLIRKFEYEILSTLKKKKKIEPFSKQGVIVTGTAAAPFMKSFVKSIHEHYGGLCPDVVTVSNKFFGETVTVSGLLTGGDILEALKGYAASHGNDNTLFFPESMFMNDTEVFLDDMTLGDLEQRIGMKCVIVKAEGKPFVETLANNLKYGGIK